MNNWLLIRRLRGPAFLLLIGVMAMLHEWGGFGFHRSWPLLLILAGVLSLAERAALSQAIDDQYDPITGQAHAATGYSGSSTSIVPPTPPASDPNSGQGRS
jgi:hypothetical protein